MSNVRNVTFYFFIYMYNIYRLGRFLFMKQARTLNIFSLIFNALLLVAFALIGPKSSSGDTTNSLYWIHTTALMILEFFTLICIPFNIIGIVKCKRLPVVPYVLKLIGTTAMLVSMLLTLVVGSITNGGNIAAILGNFDFNKGAIFYHLIIPVLALIGFIFFDYCEKGKLPVVFLAIIPTAIYSGAYILNYSLKIRTFQGTNDWYNTLSINQFGPYIIFGALIIVALLIAMLLYFINKGLYKVFFKEEQTSHSNSSEEIRDSSVANVKFIDEEVEEEPVEESEEVTPAEEENEIEEAPVQEETQEDQPVEEESQEEVQEEQEAEEVQEGQVDEPTSEEEIKEEKPVKASKKPAAKKESKESSSNNGTKVYHLTKRKEDNMWAITFVGGKKPVKLFKTKKEAEEYLEVLTKNQGATALIRNSKGAKAGKFASSIKSEEDKK